VGLSKIGSICFQNVARPRQAGRGIDPNLSSSQHERTWRLKGWSSASSFHLRPTPPGDSGLGGDKTGDWNGWYEWAVPEADDLYDTYLNELREEGLIDGEN